MILDEGLGEYFCYMINTGIFHVFEMLSGQLGAVGLIAQLVEHCTSIAEVRPEFFRLFSLLLKQR